MLNEWNILEALFYEVVVRISYGSSPVEGRRSKLIPEAGLETGPFESFTLVFYSEGDG